MARERRQFHRTPHEVEARYRLLNELTASWRAVTLINLSAGGLRFRDDEALEVGVLLELRLQLPGVNEPLNLKGRVIWSQLQASGVIEVGVGFLEVVVAHQMQIDNVVQFFRNSTPPPGVNP